MKTSRFMRTLLLAHNRIGPACGPALRALLKNTKSLKVLSLSHNRLGELVRYPNKLQRDRVRSAASDIFVGLRQNKSLEGDSRRRFIISLSVYSPSSLPPTQPWTCRTTRWGRCWPTTCPWAWPSTRA